MQTIETKRRAYRTKSQKIQLLNEQQSSGMTISTFALKYRVHPVTIHKWKRDMSWEIKKDTIDVHELLQGLENLKGENNHLKKAVDNMAITNEILQTAVDVLKKSKDGKFEVAKEVIQILGVTCSKSRVCNDIHFGRASLYWKKKENKMTRIRYTKESDSEVAYFGTSDRPFRQ
jgi:hypothetical protein